MRRALVVAILAAALAGCGKNDHAADLVSFNFCGNVCAGGTDNGVGFLSNLVRDSRARIVALQEICRSQAESARAALADRWGHADLAYVTTFDEDLAGANRCQDDDYGIAVIAPKIIRSDVEPLPNPGLGKRQIDERTILCADLGDLITCTTHIVRSVNDPQAHAAQLTALRSLLEHRVNDRFVLAGDINEPTPLAVPGYASGHHRLDHAYVSRSLTHELTTRTTSCTCSDHRALLVRFDQP